jgi:hypothetical protein
MSKDPHLIKSGLRALQGKAQLFPSDISTIQQALVDLSDNLIALLERVEALESTVAGAETGKHAAGRISPAEPADDA